jgi:hypothetical protein
MITLLATHHANARARERIGWHRRTLDRMLERVFYDGLGLGDCPRRLHAFIVASVTAEISGLTRIYGEHLYVFARDQPNVVVLKTVYALPAGLKSAAHRARHRHHALAA